MHMSLFSDRLITFQLSYQFKEIRYCSLLLWNYWIRESWFARVTLGLAFMIIMILCFLSLFSLTRLNLSASCGCRCLNWVYRHPSQLSVAGTHHGTSSAATLLVENINSSSLLEIHDNNIVSGSAYKNSSEWKYLAKRQKQVVLWIKDYYLLVIIAIMKCVAWNENWVLLRGPKIQKPWVH